MKSNLMIHDLVSGTDELVLSCNGHIEAPNWHPDGAGLLVNGAGKLFHVPLDAPELRLIDTGFANELNNDHGISPDGTLLAISDSSEVGDSAIYTLPIEGGTPVRVTKKTHRPIGTVGRLMANTMPMPPTGVTGMKFTQLVSPVATKRS